VYHAAGETRGPRLIVSTQADTAKISPDHPDATVGTLAVMRAIGTAGGSAAPHYGALDDQARMARLN
jgi:hypothetical protein